MSTKPRSVLLTVHSILFSYCVENQSVGCVFGVNVSVKDSIREVIRKKTPHKHSAIFERNLL